MFIYLRTSLPDGTWTGSNNFAMLIAILRHLCEVIDRFMRVLSPGSEFAILSLNMQYAHMSNGRSRKGEDEKVLCLD